MIIIIIILLVSQSLNLSNRNYFHTEAMTTVSFLFYRFPLFLPSIHDGAVIMAEKTL